MNKTQTSTEKPLDEIRWQAVANRHLVDGASFLYAVRTTGIYCRPGCASRTPNRENVRFFEDCELAESAGYRACLRCKPSDGTIQPEAIALAVAGCRFIESCDTPPSLQEIANSVGRSPHHYQRLFKSQVGISPKEYSAMTRIKRFAQLLKSAPSVASAIYGAGYNSSSRCYAESSRALGMSPDRYRNGGTDQTIQFGETRCSLGNVLVAITSAGICQVAIGADDGRLVEALRHTFPNAVAIDSDDDLTAILDAVVCLIDGTPVCESLPLDIRGTAFQREVWCALQKLPSGKTVTYTELAKSIGRPDAVRAVASACGANEMAVVIPCHRVVRTDGGLGGYRWGIQRKQTLLERERS